MTEPEPTYQTDEPQPDPTTAGLLEVRQFAIGLTISVERLLEARGFPVENPTKNRQERRGLTKSKR